MSDVDPTILYVSDGVRALPNAESVPAWRTLVFHIYKPGQKALCGDFPLAGSWAMYTFELPDLVCDRCREQEALNSGRVETHLPTSGAPVNHILASV